MFAGLRKLAAATGLGAGNNYNRRDSTDITSTNDEHALPRNINNRTLGNELVDIDMVDSSHDMIGKDMEVVGGSDRRSNTARHSVQSSANLDDTQGENDINEE